VSTDLLAAAPSASPSRNPSTHNPSTHNPSGAPPATAISQLEALADAVHALNVSVLVLRLWREVGAPRLLALLSLHLSVCLLLWCMHN
jgi:hypothetical protein